MDKPSPIEIRPFSPELQEQVIDLIVTIQQKEFNIPITADQQPDLKAIPAYYQQGAGNFWVALHGGKAAGTISLLDIGEGSAALRKMFVHKSFRGEKTGTAYKLLNVSLEWAREKGLRSIYLGTTSKFLAAHRFYEKHGFVEIEKEDLPAAFPIMEVDVKFCMFSL